MFCTECGAQNPDTNQFCQNCGKPLGRQQAAAPAASPATVPQPAPAPAGTPSVPVMRPATAAAPTRARNWPGIVSIILGILSWAVLTGILAIGAVLLGIISLVWFRKMTGRTGISSIIGIVLGIAAIVITIALP
jgi:hypothetical protein